MFLTSLARLFLALVGFLLLRSVLGRIMGGGGASPRKSSRQRSSPAEPQPSAARQEPAGPKELSEQGIDEAEFEELP